MGRLLELVILGVLLNMIHPNLPLLVYMGILVFVGIIDTVLNTLSGE